MTLPNANVSFTDIKGAVPLPLSVTFVGVFGALCVIASVAVRAPVVVGVNVMVMSWFAPAARVALVVDNA